ncbi:hypothetical protein [Kitasatospora sp. NPDC088346]|uniref:hypothetical protein n=1 Tax=Kitasatospora sp. NPDC088346 TaxID=3364073 RepID=UPI003829F3A2
MSGDSTGERNPFAPPPADAPDQPWQPRIPPAGPGPQDGEDGDGRPQVPPPHPWSPGHRGGGWNPPQPAPKFDPNDPAQRRARHALIAGMGGLFCTIVGIYYVALLLGALAVYWAISALRSGRAQGRAEGRTEARTEPTGAPAAQPQAPAAIGGLFTGAVVVLFTLGWLGAQLYYNDYVVCVKDAPTAAARHSCTVTNPVPRLLVAMVDPESL